jgi:hypothetical protein
MNQHSFEEMYLANQWLMTVQSQLSFALSMSRQCSGEFADLILSETAKTTQQIPPKSPDELALRHRQASALTSKISAITHADSMSRIVRGAAAEILTVTREHCAGDLPKTDADFQKTQQATLDLVETIARLCNTAWSPQI